VRAPIAPRKDSAIETVTAEQDFVIAATAPQPRPATALPALAELDPQALLDVANRNKVVPRVVRAVGRSLRDQGGAARWGEALRAGERLARGAHRRHQETCEILSAFHASGIPAAPLKGTFLALRLYDDVTARQSSDIDLLVPQQFFLDALRLLTERGYQLVEPVVLPRADGMNSLFDEFLNYNVVLRHRDHGQHIELHWRVTHYRRFPGEADRRLWDRLHEDTVEDLRFWTMNDTDLLLYMAAHGVKDHWRRLSWLADFAFLALRSQPATTRAAAIAEHHGLSVVWGTACRLSDVWYGTALAPPTISGRVRYIVDHASLMLPRAVEIRGGARRYLWNTADSWPASVKLLMADYTGLSYTFVSSERDYHPTLQRLRRLRARVGRRK
jgi:hypothetical protein